MSFAKYFEDNCKIVEERVTLGKQEERPVWFSVTLTETVYAPLKHKAPKKVKYKTKKLVCSDCGTSFFFEGGEQRYFARHNLRAPKRCRACRKARRQNPKNNKHKED